MPPAAPRRLPWVDHLRTFVILLVVNMHACVTYTHVGDWYVTSEREPSLAEKIPYIVWQAHLQSFFMGLLFFVAGYFAQGSVSRRGPGGFERERLVRLGLPTLFYMLAIHPFILLALNPWHARFGDPIAFYGKYLRTGKFLSSSGPMWFAFALLIFCSALAGWRAVHPAGSLLPADRLSALPSASAVPSGWKLWFFALGLGCASFLVRLVQPLGTNILNMQLCYFVQYIAFFIVGLHAARRGWLLSLARSTQARRAGWVALVGGPMLLLAVMYCGGRGRSDLSVFRGGWRWQAFGLSVWEQLAGVGLSLGALALFSGKLNRETGLLQWLADRSFAVYVLHPPILVALFMVYRGLPQHTFPLVLLLTATGLVASYVIADLARRLPGFRSIL